MSATTYLDNRVLTYITSTTLYLGLFTANPGNTGSQTSEVTGGGYARQSITFSSISSGSTSNSSAIIFPTSTASWGTITYFAVLDSLTNGNMLFYVAVPTSRTIASGQVLTVNINGITITVS